MDRTERYTRIVMASIEDAVAGISNLDPEILDIPGMSGTKTRHFLNNLVQAIGGRYLEVGVHAGSTFTAALNGSITNYECVAIDNWSEFGHQQSNFIKYVKKFINISRIKVIIWQKDFRLVTEDVLKTKEYGKFPIYLYDGPHGKQDHIDALTCMIDYLEDDFIYICDDWNWDSVSDGTYEALLDLEITVHKSFVMKTPGDTDQDVAGWWNGYYVAVCCKPKK